MPTERTDKTFNEWSHKVLDELVALNSNHDRIKSELQSKYDLLNNVIAERYENINEKLERMNVLLTGNGTPERGLLVRVDRLEQRDVEDLDVRVDRLEQSDSRRTWLMRAVVVTCLGTIMTTVAMLTRGHLGLKGN